MALTNPDILIPILDELNETLHRWVQRSAATLADARNLQRQGQDITQQAVQEAGRLLTQHHQDADRVRYVYELVTHLQSLSQQALSEIHGLNHAAGVLQAQAEHTRNHWQTELNKALQWLTRAKKRLADAHAWLERAIQHTRKCAAAVSQAQNALSNCRSNIRRDKDGRTIYPNCTSQEVALGNAQYALQKAQQDQQAAQLEVNLARAEVQEAQARVNTCQTALMHAQQAVHFAQQACAQGWACEATAQRCAEEVAAALQSWENAAQHLTQQETSVSEVQTHVARTEDAHDTAYHSLHEGERAGESAQDLATHARQELDIRTGFLRKFASVLDLPHPPEI